MVKKITELEKAMTAPMAPMAPRDYMAAMQHAAMQVKVFQLFLHFYSGCHGPGQHGYEQHWWHAAGKT